MSSEEKKSPLKVKKFVVGWLFTNCYLVYEEKTKKGVLIDPGVHDAQIAEYIQDNGIDVICTVNTHGHADHITGDAGFGFPVMIHELDEACLHDAEKSLSSLTGEDVQSVRAERLLRDGDTIDLGELKLEVIHTPGHTPGGISIRCGDLLFSGDTLFYEGIGRTDCPGGDHDTIIKSVKERLLTLPDHVEVFPGHGPETTIGHEKKNNPFI